MEMEMEMEMACDRGKGLARGKKNLGFWSAGRAAVSA